MRKKNPLNFSFAQWPTVKENCATFSAALRCDCLHLYAFLSPLNTPPGCIIKLECACNLLARLNESNSRKTLFTAMFLYTCRDSIFCVLQMKKCNDFSSHPLQCTCGTLRCPPTGPLDSLAPPYLHASLQEARYIVEWDLIPRTTPWETTGLREGSTVHKVRPHGRGVRPSTVVKERGGYSVEWCSLLSHIAQFFQF